MIVAIALLASVMVIKHQQQQGAGNKARCVANQHLKSVGAHLYVLVRTCGAVASRCPFDIVAMSILASLITSAA